MQRRRSTPVIATFVVSLVVAMSMLVTWVLYTVRSASRISELANRVGVQAGNVHWIVLGIGCGLLFLLIGGLSYQLALALATRRYLEKQEEFISNMTHELKSPLAAIKLHSQTLLASDLEPSTQERSLGFILQQADRMEQLVDNVLESSRLISRRRFLDLVPVDLHSFFQRYFEEELPRLEQRHVAIEPTTETLATVMATEDALHRMMNNLLENAVRFSESGGEVRCRVRDLDDKVQIEVEDDGAGIPRKELGKIFDRFYQAGTEIDRRRRGSGLGLSIVAELVRREMGGTIRAYSNEGRAGTRFVIELPMAPSSAIEPRVSEESP